MHYHHVTYPAVIFTDNAGYVVSDQGALGKTCMQMYEP